MTRPQRPPNENKIKIRAISQGLMLRGSGRRYVLTQQGHGAPVARGTLAELNDYLLAGGPE